MVPNLSSNKYVLKLTDRDALIPMTATVHIQLKFNFY